MISEVTFRKIGVGTGALLLAPIAAWLLAMGIGGVCSACCEFCVHLF